MIAGFFANILCSTYHTPPCDIWCFCCSRHVCWEMTLTHSKKIFSQILNIPTLCFNNIKNQYSSKIECHEVTATYLWSIDELKTRVFISCNQNFLHIFLFVSCLPDTNYRLDRFWTTRTITCRIQDVSMPTFLLYFYCIYITFYWI